MNKISVLLFTVASMISINSYAQNFQTAPYVKGAEVTNNTVIYALPATNLEFEIEVVKNTITAGPYANYAKAYLNLDVPTTNSETWEINAGYIDVHYVIDPSQYYLISFKDYPKNVERLITITKEGNILDMSLPGFLSSSEFSGPQANNDFRSLNIDGSLTSQYDTIYTTIMTDSMVIKTPSILKTISILPIEDQALAVAEQIKEIRQRRYDLSIDGSEYPDGASLRFANEELDKQEQELLSLFVGGSSRTVFSRKFSLTPDKNNLKVPLCYFSQKTGITSKPIATEIYCEINILQSNQPVIGIEETKKPTNKNIVYYRIPAQTEIKMTYQNETLATMQVPMYQMGNLMSIPLLSK